MIDIVKFPRTPHVEGSRLQPGDHDLEPVPFDAIRGRRIVVTEKLDGANAAIRFAGDGSLMLQSRGHFLVGGPRERQFDLFKTWAHAHQPDLWSRLGSRHVLYGEWLYARHTLYYDELPHYFLAFDVLDLERDAFLATDQWHAMLAGGPVATVPILHAGLVDTVRDLRALIKTSCFRSPRWRDRLREVCTGQNLDWERVLTETDLSDLAEGLYIKCEEDGVVTRRLKLVRDTFASAVAASGSHWADRPMVPNRLREGANLFG